MDPERARNYIVHTMIADPVCDEMMVQLGEVPLRDADRFIRAAIENPDDPSLDDAPAGVHAFIEELETVPDWVDYDEFADGIRAFHRDSSACLAAMLGGVLVEGFSTTIAKSFFITGRLRDQGVRRLRQNNRHMIEILLPGGLETRGDGWRLSVRIRLVHAKVRQLFNDSDEWDSAAQGVPLSAAQVGYALTSFSARMLQHMKGLGASYDDTERDGFMAVWRYSGYLMGIPETILYHDYDDALELFRVGGLCEPDPGMESVVLANSLVNSAPVVAGITEPAARRKLAKYVFLVSRAMIGNPMADNLQYPPNHTFGVLPWFRFQRRYHQFLKKRFPKLSRESSFTAFNTLLEVSALQELDIDYKLPDHIHSEESRWW
ncbi:MAG: oxygenase MpaB family protein [Acidimicrobiaceae bacterium]|nr:oxygenase MpaB family protein [Acidimicrobiaceae bacterium]